MANKRIIDVGAAALRDLYGLVPQKDHKYAEDYLRTLEHVLNTYADALGRMTQIESALHFGNLYIESKLTEIERIG
jgi:hypothetical protein